MAELRKDIDALIAPRRWEDTPLGPVSSWPRALLTVVDAILPAKIPMVVLWGREMIQVYNEGWSHVCGPKHPAAMGISNYDCWPEVRQWTEPVYNRVMAGETVAMEDQLLMVVRGGPPEPAYFTLSYSPLRGDDGNIGGLLAVVIENTEKVKAERSRAEAEAARERHEDELRLALDAARIGWWRLDVPTSDVYWDDRAAEIFGVPSDPRAYAQVLAQVVSEDAVRLDAAVRAAIDPAVAAKYDVEYRIRRADGSLRWLRSNGLAQFAGEGDARHAKAFFGTVIDITDAKEAEAQYRAAAERLEVAMSAADLGSWSWDPATDLMTVSERAAEMYGTGVGPYPREEGRELIPEPYRTRTREEARRSVAEAGQYRTEYPIVRRDGRELWIAAHGKGLYDASGRLAQMIGVVQDVTARKRVEEEREALLAAEQSARNEAERANRMKDDFLATLSHELRTPLNAIIGWSDILLSAPASRQDLDEGLETIQRNARAQAQIIEDLLDMSRVVSGKLVLDARRADLADVVRSAAETVRPSAVAKRIDYSVNVRTSDDLAVWGDASRLQQVVWNLASNAVKFTPTGGSVGIEARREGERVVLSVSDSGIGIAREFLPHVFDRFRQADASTTRRHGGLGLGLALVRQLAEMHGGSVRVLSEGAGRGATFTVELPALTCAGGAGSPDRGGLPAAPARLSASQIDLADLRVLLVDDEGDALAFERRLLEDRGAAVWTAGSAAEAFEVVRRERLDVIVSDIGMPGEDGYTLIRRIRALRPAPEGHTPAIALTAYARSEDRVRAIRAGFQMHVAKPVDPAELVATIASLADRGSAVLDAGAE